MKKGQYTVSNVLSIPSNTMIKLQNGAIVKKGKTTGRATFKPSQTFFQLVPLSKVNKKSEYKKYNGAKNIKIISTGKAVIDLNNSVKTPAILMAYAQNITISGIEFKRNNQASTIHIWFEKD